MSEDTLHIWTAKYLRLSAVCPWWHVPNQGKRSIQWVMKLKKMGMRAGVPDFCFILPPVGRSAFLELKYGKRGQRIGQEAFQADAEAAGAFYEIARTSDEVIGILRGWGAVRGSAMVNDILRGAA